MAFEFTKGTDRSYNCTQTTTSMKTGGNAENLRSIVASAHGIEEQTVESLATKRNCVLPTKDDASFEWKRCYRIETQSVPTAVWQHGVWGLHYSLDCKSL